MAELIEMTAGDLVDGDVITFTESLDAIPRTAMEVEQGDRFMSVRWQGQGERCQMPRTRIVFKLRWTS